MLSTWNKMKASSVDEKTTEDLKQWLEKPRDGSEAGLGLELRQDLEWAQNSKDLSSISLNQEKAKSMKEAPSDNRTPSIKNDGAASDRGANGGGGGGFLAMFGCASKRK
jgi:hypothetical protein